MAPAVNAMIDRIRVMRCRLCCNRLGWSLTACVRLAMRPNCVVMPVETTTARPVPEKMEVPAKTMFGRSSSVNPSRNEASAVLRDGVASPVRVESLVRRPNSSTTRLSAGTLSPSARTSTSPGTTLRARISTSTLSRITSACAGSSFLSAPTACSARNSRQKEKPALIRTTIQMTTPMTGRAPTIAISPAPHSNNAIGCVRKMRNLRQMGGGGGSRKTLAPYKDRRSCAICDARPSGDVSSAENTSSGLRAYSGCDDMDYAGKTNSQARCA